MVVVLDDPPAPCTALTPLPDEVLLYIRNLEDRVGQLENGSEFPFGKPAFPSSRLKEPLEEEEAKEEGGVRPESVSNAMKVLEVHEDMLERGEGGEGGDLGDGEKALVREMCNVSPFTTVTEQCTSVHCGW